MFVDEIEVSVIGGSGGPGKISFFPMKGGPNGGSGGNGGSVYAVATDNMNNLNRYSGLNEFKAEAGGAGGSNRKEGARGDDLEILVPVGTMLKDVEDGTYTELKADGERVKISRGGRGGWGNEAFKTATFQTPQKSEPGEPGEKEGLE